MPIYKNKLQLLILALLLSSMLGACGSHEEKLKSYMKCGIAATQLGKWQAAQEIGDSADAYIAENEDRMPSGSLAAYASFIGQEVRDDLNLERYDLQSQVRKLIRIYNSSTCQKMHKQGTI